MEQLRGGTEMRLGELRGSTEVWVEGPRRWGAEGRWEAGAAAAVTGCRGPRLFLRAAPGPTVPHSPVRTWALPPQPPQLLLREAGPGLGHGAPSSSSSRRAGPAAAPAPPHRRRRRTPRTARGPRAAAAALGRGGQDGGLRGERESEGLGIACAPGKAALVGTSPRLLRS